MIIFQIGDVVRYVAKASELFGCTGTVVPRPAWRRNASESAIFVDFGVVNRYDDEAPGPTTIWGCGLGYALRRVYSATDPT